MFSTKSFLVFMFLYVSVSLTFIFLLTLPSVAVAPPNHNLVSSPWAIAQHDNYAQGSTTSEGPKAAEGVDTIFSALIAGPLTVVYSKDEKIVWGSSLRSVFKVDRSNRQMRLIDVIEKPPELRRNDTFRGIYCFLSDEDVFYFSISNVIMAYTDMIKGDSESGIKQYGRLDVSELIRDDERVLAVNLSYDGSIIFVTNKGGIGVVSKDLRRVITFDYLTKDKGMNPPVDVTNSLAIDEFGGIYVVTSKYMHRLWWEHKTETLYRVPPNDDNDASYDEETAKEVSTYRVPCAVDYNGDKIAAVEQRKCQIWSTFYPGENEIIVGRPTKKGSGTTPTVLKDERTGKLYIVIADGRRTQHVLAIATETGKLVASAPVSFSSEEDSSGSNKNVIGRIMVSGLGGNNNIALRDSIEKKIRGILKNPEKNKERNTIERSGSGIGILESNGGIFYDSSSFETSETGGIDVRSASAEASLRRMVEQVLLHENRRNNNQQHDSYTEQSILVNKNKLLVTQNALTFNALRLNRFLESINAERIIADIGLPEFIEENVFLLPVLLGDDPRGFQQFQLITNDDGSAKLRTTWVRSDIGCPNAIPTMSETTGLMYCVGKREPIANSFLMQGFVGGWTVRALDWTTGESVFIQDVGKSILYNSLYAATQIGPQKEVIYGAIGGLVRIRSKNDDASVGEPSVWNLDRTMVTSIEGRLHKNIFGSNGLLSGIFGF